MPVGAALAAPSLSGTWTAQFAGSPIVLAFTGKAPTYTGSYTYRVASMVKNKVQYRQQAMPVTATLSVGHSVTRVALNFTKTQLHVQCVLTKSGLSCVAPFGSAPIVFKHQAH
jgi:hypothetical protein